MGVCNSKQKPVGSDTGYPDNIYIKSHPDYDPRYAGYSSNPEKNVHNPQQVTLNEQQETERTAIAKEIFALINVSGSGEISVQEFMNWVKPPSDLDEKEHQKRRDMNAWLLFRLDKDKNASIDLEEMQSFFKRFTLAESKIVQRRTSISSSSINKPNPSQTAISPKFRPSAEAIEEGANGAFV